MSLKITPLPADSAVRIRELFRGANYCLEGIEGVFGTSGMPRPNANNLEPMLERTRENTRLNVLVRLFVMGIDVPEKDLLAVVDSESVRLMAEAGMLVASGDVWQPQMMLVPFQELLVASDNHHRLYSQDSFDYVLAMNPSAKHLHDFTMRIPCENALDLCAGCGVHALSMAEHAKTVVSADLNERAAEFIQFSAALNGRDNIRSVSGDRLAPIAGQKFDLIACNPPFVLSPSKEFMYRDNDLDIDQFVRDLIQQAPDYLNRGGFFQIVLEWAEVTGQSWQDRIKEWLADTPCDVLVLKANSLLPESYAKRRVVEMHEGAPGDYSDEIKQWVDYFRSFNVRGIHGGLIAIRKSDSPGWFRFDDVSQGGDYFGDYVHAAFATEDFLRSEASTESIMEGSFRLTEDMRLSQQSIAADGGWQSVDCVLTFPNGWYPPVALDDRIAQVVVKFDGQHTVAELNRIFAELVGASPEDTCSDFCEGVREFLRRGVLRVPA